MAVINQPAKETTTMQVNSYVDTLLTRSGGGDTLDCAVMNCWVIQSLFACRLLEVYAIDTQIIIVT